jgi:hypothetical protein
MPGVDRESHGCPKSDAGEKRDGLADLKQRRGLVFNHCAVPSAYIDYRSAALRAAWLVIGGRQPPTPPKCLHSGCMNIFSRLPLGTPMRVSAPFRKNNRMKHDISSEGARMRASN